MSETQEADAQILDGRPAPGAQGVLVAEDSPVTQDLLKLVLEQRGHRVEMAADGPTALDALRKRPFDVALLDYNMPGLNGLEVVVAFLAEQPDGRRPHFVAITGDVEGLLENPANCEHFDRVLPKPLDINMVCDAVEELAGTVPTSGPTSGPGGSGGAAERSAAAGHGSGPRRRSPVESLDYRFLRWPDDLNPRMAGGRALRSIVGEDYDAVLIREPVPPPDRPLLWNGRGRHLLPVIDLTASLGGCADLDASTLATSDADTVRELIETFHDRRAGLHRDLVHSDAPADKLLGRIHVAGGTLMPRLDGAARGFVSYNTMLDLQALRPTASRLVEEGMLAAEFFDRLHVCASCASARFNVREECPECGAACLEEVSYLHHFSCAYQGPESDFRDGDDLVCPKCRRELRRFGRDYDRPGMMVVCAACGNGTSEPAVGFVCVDCANRYDGDTVETRDIFSYRLTDRAAGYLEAGQSFLGLAQRSLRFAELPLDLVIALNDAAKRFNDSGTPFSLLNIAYENERELSQQLGPRQFARLRQLFLETMQQVLRGEAKLSRGQAFDYALLPGAEPNRTRAGLDELCGRAAAALRHDPGAMITVFGPEDIG